MNIIDIATKTMQTAIKSVVDAVKTVVDSIKTTTDTTNTNVGAPTTAANNATSANAHAKLNFLIAEANAGIIKRIQRGTTSIANASTTTVNITAVNLSKSILIFNSSEFYNDQTLTATGTFDTSSRLRFDRMNAGQHQTKIEWQVIEFY